MLPMGITVLDLSAYVGLVAVGAVAINMLLGMLMAFRYSPVRYWPHRRFNYFASHNWSGYIAHIGFDPASDSCCSSTRRRGFA